MRLDRHGNSREARDINNMFGVSSVGLAEQRNRKLSNVLIQRLGHG